MDLPNRRDVLLSPMFSRVERNRHLTVQQLRQDLPALSPDQLRNLHDALRSIDIELTRGDAAEKAAIGVSLTRFCALTCPNWTPEQREEWMTAATEELADLPFLLLMPALEAARRAVDHPRKLIPWCYAQLAEKMGRLEVEREIMARMIEIEDGRD